MPFYDSNTVDRCPISRPLYRPPEPLPDLSPADPDPTEGGEDD